MKIPFPRTIRWMQDDQGPMPWPVLVLLAATVVGWVGWFFFGRVKVYAVAQTARVEVDAMAHGVQTPVAGVVIENHLNLGRPVLKGDLLLVLDSTAERLQLAHEGTKLRGQRRALDALQRQIEAENQAMMAQARAAGVATMAALARGRVARTISEQASQEDKMMQELRTNALATGLEALKSASEVRRQQAEALAASMEANQTAAVGQRELKDRLVQLARLEFESANLQTEVDQIEANIKRLEFEIERRTVRAAVSGTVADLSPSPVGSTLAVGQRVAVLVPEGSSRVVAHLPPAEAVGRVRAGQTGIVRLDAFPWTEYGVLRARVSQVAHEPHEGLIRTELWLETTNTAISVGHGLTGSVEIELETIAPYKLLLRSAGQMAALPAPAPAASSSLPSARLP